MTATPSFKSWTITEPIPGDASARRYHRVAKNGKNAILMDCSAEKPQDKKIESFVKIASWLNNAGLKAPRIYEQDNDFLLIEDFGGTSFKTAVAGGESMEGLYLLAGDVLRHIGAQKDILKLPDYYQSPVHKGRRRIIDWYAPSVHGRKNPDGWVAEYLKTWDTIEKFLPPCPQGFVHMDFHPENLMWLPQEKGLKRCGILDFQDAMVGPVPYDLANLLEDARTDVPDDIRETLLSSHDDTFRAWYRVLATQFHCRVIGQFIKLALVSGKTQYLQYIPRLEGYMQEALEDPLLKPLKVFFSEIGLDFQNTKDLNAGLSMKHIRDDAF